VSTLDGSGSNPAIHRSCHYHLCCHGDGVARIELDRDLTGVR
jgi:hypothetical protein